MHWTISVIYDHINFTNLYRMQHDSGSLPAGGPVKVACPKAPPCYSTYRAIKGQTVGDGICFQTGNLATGS